MKVFNNYNMNKEHLTSKANIGRGWGYVLKKKKERVGF